MLWLGKPLRGVKDNAPYQFLLQFLPIAANG